MRGRQRGNTILISAILVLALTAAALTVTRILTAQTSAQAAVREFLGEQAYAECLLGLDRLSKNGAGASPVIYNDFSIPMASNSVTAVTPATVSLTYTPAGVIAINTTYTVVATASVTGVYPQTTVSRQVSATVTCGAALPCSYVITNQ